jgi:serine protease
MVWASGGAVTGVPANANKARVLNLSLGGSGACDTTTQNAINSARSRGAVVVVAAGNSNINAINSNPANCAGVITVAATNRAGGKASYSNYGANVDDRGPGRRQRRGHPVDAERGHHDAGIATTTPITWAPRWRRRTWPASSR